MHIPVAETVKIPLLEGIQHQQDPQAGTVHMAVDNNKEQEVGKHNLAVALDTLGSLEQQGILVPKRLQPRFSHAPTDSQQALLLDQLLPF